MLHDADVNPFPLFLTSGDLLADRRYELGRSFSADNQPAAAADLFAQTVELAPHWAPAWLALGLAHEECDDREAALAALRRASALDPSGQLGIALHMSRFEEPRLKAMPENFIAMLFDQYAGRFEEHLVGHLGYRGPTLMTDALSRSGCSGIDTALDLGCGTGLMGRALSGRVVTLDGVDLSARMIELARSTGLYRTLSVAGLLAHLGRTAAASYDLVLAADVLVYVGALDALMSEARRVLRPHGMFAFTVQTLSTGEGFALGPDLRFSHARPYIEHMLTEAGFTIVVVEVSAIRQESGIDVPGLVVVARRA